jgi:hypothetical protein
MRTDAVLYAEGVTIDDDTNTSATVNKTVTWDLPADSYTVHFTNPTELGISIEIADEMGLVLVTKDLNGVSENTLSGAHLLVCPRPPGAVKRP